jgi:hypothetical protein
MAWCRFYFDRLANSHTFFPIDTVYSCMARDAGRRGDECIVVVAVASPRSSSSRHPARFSTPSRPALLLSSRTFPVRWDAHGAYGGQHARLHLHSGSRPRSSSSLSSRSKASSTSQARRGECTSESRRISFGTRYSDVDGTLPHPFYTPPREPYSGNPVDEFDE